MTVRAAGQRGRTGTAATVTDPARIRNVVLVGPSGAGKTTLVEALLAHTGTIPRAGSITEGTTVGDHDPAAVRQQRSVALSVAPLLAPGPDGDTKINLIDTPGYGDFVGELRAGLRAADGALFVVPASAGREGPIDPATVTQWEECAAVGMPRGVVIARCDHPRADLEATVAACQEAFGAGVAPLYLPLRTGDAVTGLYGLISQTPEGSAPPDADDARAALVEGIIEQSEDETLMERYLGGEDIDTATLIKDLETAVARGSFHPVVPVCAMSGVGVDALLEVLVGGFPSPLEHPLPPVSGIDGSPRPALAADPDGPLAAEVIRTSADAYVGRVSLVRVFSGTLRPETAIHVSGHVATGAEDGADDAGGRRARQRRAPRPRLRAARRPDAGGRQLRRGRHRRADQARQRRDRRHDLRGRGPAAAVLLGAARPAAAGRGRRPQPGRRGRAGPRPDPPRRRRPDAAPRAQPGDPPDRAVVHGRGARRRRALPAAGRRRRGRHRAGEGSAARHDPLGGTGDRAARQAVRRARPVRRVPRRVRAAALAAPGSSSSRGWSAGRSRRSSSPAWRRASGPSSSAG